MELDLPGANTDAIDLAVERNVISKARAAAKWCPDGGSCLVAAFRR